MKLTFLGGADEVGASSTLIEIAGKKLLVDAGIRISNKTVRGIQSDQLPDLHVVTEAGGPDYILVTHAHTDHTGALPLVLEQYPDVPVLATAPTIALVKVLQADAQNIMKNKQEQEGELPLFDEIAVNRLLEAFQIVEFRKAIHLGDGLQVTYHPAGHIVGAASLVIESEEGILVMSGDLSMTPQRAVVRAQLPRPKADFLVLESTYGGRLHANREAEERRLIETLKRVVERGGKALIPAFALGRAQEVLQILLTYRDEIDVPVWADGMVRAVCQAYNTFPELLPAHTVKAAGADDLFFRKNIKPVRTPVQREEIARAPEPAIIVASSGMLTGGPSAAFAKWLAGDERNGIFLTGYQDEEAPGRFLQRLIKERQEGQDVAFRIDDATISLRCELGTYALSAHADEAELLSIADSFGAEDIALVHGDAGARHSLASSLRDRSKRVRLPISGTGIELQFTKRPWALGVVKGSQAQAKPLETATLWESLKESAGGFFSTRELAHAWWGDGDRAGEVAAVLEHDGVYFAQDWRKSTTFQVRTPDKVARSLHQRQIMQMHPKLVGQLVVLQDANQRPRLAVVTDAKIDSFKAQVLKAKGQFYPADALIWAIGEWEHFKSEEGTTTLKKLESVFQKVEALRDRLMPFEKRQALLRKGEPVDPTALLPETLPEGVSGGMALATIVYSLAKDGVVRLGEKLLLKEAKEGEALEQNLARKTALAAFPPEARLRRVGIDNTRKRLTLSFDFPQRAEAEYRHIIETLNEQTGWEVVVMEEVNQQALGTALLELLPVGAHMVKGPSFYMDKGEVMAEFSGLEDDEALRSAYEALTGFRLVIGGKSGSPTTAVSVAPSASNKAQMEVNKAYDLIRNALERYGLYKTSLKQGKIVLSFISPQVAVRHENVIAELSRKTGYEMDIHPHPNQNSILQIATQIAREANLSIRKGPSIHVDRGEVALTLAELPDEATAALMAQIFEEQTGYRLLLNA